MYVPAAFAEADQTKLHEFIERNSFGALVSQVGGLPFATHLPFLLDRSAGPLGALVGHMARANAQWREAAGQTALAIFTGPHAYISPTWYQAEDVVPTWNYAAVHAYGLVETVEDQAALLDIVQKSVQIYERAMPRPWSFDSSSAFVDRMLAQIVGFRIRIEKLEGKFKLNQNHPAQRREKVIQALRKRGGENAEAIAAMMDAMLHTGVMNTHGRPANPMDAAVMETRNSSENVALAAALAVAAGDELARALDRIQHCLGQLTDVQVWQRESAAMNSIGNLILHLCGNLRQWIVAGLGGEMDVRQRPLEFSERGPIPKAELLRRLHEAVSQAQAALKNAAAHDLQRPRRIQGFELTGLEAIFDAVPHFRGHTQEIVHMTRSMLGDGYQFAWAPSTPEEGA